MKNIQEDLEKMRQDPDEDIDIRIQDRFAWRQILQTIAALIPVQEVDDVTDDDIFHDRRI